MRENEYRTFNGNISSVDGESRHVEGYAIRFNEESQNLGFYETIDKRALTQDVIDKSDIYCKLNHRDDAILARSRYGEGSLSLELRDDGLFYSFDAPHTQYGDELLEHIKRGEISTSSFAFVVSDEPESERWYKEEGTVKRTIYKIGELFDVSPTFEGAYLTTSCSTRTLRALDKVKELSEEDEPTDDEETKTEEEPVKEDKEDVDNDGNTPNDDANDSDDNKTREVKEDKSSEEDEDEPKSDEKTDNKRNNNFKKENTMEFRLLKAINAVANNKQMDETASAVIGAGVEEMRKSGLSYGGQIQIPTSELRSTITVSAEGEDVVATDLYDIVEPLRAKNVLVQAGAKFLTGLVGDVQVPVMGAGNVAWEGETADAPDAGYAFTSVKLSPKRLTAYVDVSKQFLVQDSKSAEALIRQDIVNAINSKLESTILGTEAGSTTQPAGMFNGQTVNKITDFAGICDLEAGIEDANVSGECKYVMSNKAKAAFRNMAKSSKSTELVMEAGAIDGTQVLNTSNVPNKDVIYGDFSNLAIGQWGGIDLTVDPYTKAAAGQVRLVVNAYFDAKVLRDGAFAYGTTDSAATAY